MGGDPNSPFWCPAEVDSTLQMDDNWFYVDGWPIHPLTDLWYTWHNSLGVNANWILDIAVPPNTSVAPAHMTQYQALGDWLRGCYDQPVASGWGNDAVLTVNFTAPTAINRVRLMEDITAGQLIRQYDVYVLSNSSWMHVSNGTSVGAMKIDLFPTNITASAVQLVLPGEPVGVSLAAFYCTDP